MSNRLLQLTLLCWVCGSPALADDSGLLTLFTTPKERQLIDANRYRAEKPADAQPAQAAKPLESEAEAPEQVLVEVRHSFRISGISIANDGSRTAWVNGQAYEDGEVAEHDVKVRIVDGAQKQVRLIAPNGKAYAGVSGETVEIGFMRPAESD
jgi:hypothetical protein